MGSWDFTWDFPSSPQQHPLVSRQAKALQNEGAAVFGSRSAKNLGPSQRVQGGVPGSPDQPKTPKGRASRVYQHSMRINPGPNSSQRGKYQECLSLSCPSISGSDSLSAAISGCARTCTIPQFQLQGLQPPLGSSFAGDYSIENSLILSGMSLPTSAAAGIYTQGTLPGQPLTAGSKGGMVLN